MTEPEYEIASNDAVANSWAEFEAEKYAHAGPGVYEQARATYADEKLIVAVTDIQRMKFITCFHEHFKGGMKRHHAVLNSSVGLRQLDFKTQLDRAEQSGMVRNVRRIRGV